MFILSIAFGCSAIYAQSTMDPVTHMLTGACLSRAGLNRRAAYATLTLVVAAELPDIDMLWEFHGPITSFIHHRGFTHTFLGLPFEATVLVGFVWLLHRWRIRRTTTHDRNVAMLTKVPVRWHTLWLISLLALLSHILLDWTNSYGVRPFAPFNPRWYAGSFVYIFEPLLFLLLLAGLIAPSFRRLTRNTIDNHKELFCGTGWARFALASAALLWSFRFVEHAHAVTLMERNIICDGGEPLRSGNLTVSPYPITPFSWHAVIDTSQYQRIYELNTRSGIPVSEDRSRLIFKPRTTPGTLAAERSELGQAYLDWGPRAIITDTGRDPAGNTLVIFRDLRYAYDTILLQGRQRTPMTGSVLLDSDDRVVRSTLDGRTQEGGK